MVYYLDLFGTIDPNQIDLVSPRSRLCLKECCLHRGSIEISEISQSMLNMLIMNCQSYGSPLGVLKCFAGF